MKKIISLICILIINLGCSYPPAFAQSTTSGTRHKVIYTNRGGCLTETECRISGECNLSLTCDDGTVAKGECIDCGGDTYKENDNGEQVVCGLKNGIRCICKAECPYNQCRCLHDGVEYSPGEQVCVGDSLVKYCDETDNHCSWSSNSCDYPSICENYKDSDGKRRAKCSKCDDFLLGDQTISLCPNRKGCGQNKCVSNKAQNGCECEVSCTDSNIDSTVKACEDRIGCTEINKIYKCLDDPNNKGKCICGVHCDDSTVEPNQLLCPSRIGCGSLKCWPTLDDATCFCTTTCDNSSIKPTEEPCGRRRGCLPNATCKTQPDYSGCFCTTQCLNTEIKPYQIPCDKREGCNLGKCIASADNSQCECEHGLTSNKEPDCTCTYEGKTHKLNERFCSSDLKLVLDCSLSAGKCTITVPHNCALIGPGVYKCEDNNGVPTCCTTLPDGTKQCI